MTGHSGRRIAERPLGLLDVLVDRDVPYTAQLTADVCYPEADGPWPVAVVLHGGEDHKATMSGFGRAAAARGLVVFLPEWRSFPAQLKEHRLAAIEDVTRAIRFARDRAGGYGGDGERIVMAGWSLGGNFAAIAALRPAEGETQHCVSGVVGLDGAYDFAEIILADPGEGFTWTANEVNEISAHSYVHVVPRDDPPVFRLFSGRESQLHAQAERFLHGLERSGFDVDLVRHPELSHEEVILAPGTIDALVDLAYT
jgi:acetyl esterase/lipase